MKTAVVTGAGRGLGRLIAEGLAQKGFAVLVADIDGNAAADTARAIGGNAWSAEQDVRVAASHHAIASEASARGPLAVWVNNAGVLRTGSAWEHSEEDIRLQVEVNVLGVIFGCQAAVEAMRREGGHIINIASISSLTPAPGVAVYGATKQAVLGFSVSLQGDLTRAGLDIKVSALCPDAIDTNMVRDVQNKKDSALLFSAGRLLTPQAVAAKAVELVDKPRLVKITPSTRGFLAHVVHPFPALSLKILQQYWKIGDRHRRGE